MSALTSAFDNFKQGLLYRGREGHLLFIGHRLAGLGTLLFLTTHIIDTSWAYFWPEGYGHAVELYRSAPMMVGEMLLMAAVLFHGVNGLHIILKDTFPHWWNKKTETNAFWRIAVVTALLWIPAAGMMFNSFYQHAICNCAPEMTLAQIEARTNAALLGTPIIFVVVLAVLMFGAQIANRTNKPRTVATARTLETYGWLFMRWSGVLLVPIVWGHVFIQDVLVGVHAIDIDYVAMRWAVVGWQAYDIVLLAFTFAHGMNGLRAVAEDYIHHATVLRAVKWVIFSAWAVITAIGGIAIVMSGKA